MNSLWEFGPLCKARRTIGRKTVTLAACLFAGLFCTCGALAAGEADDYEIHVIKSQRLLMLKRGDRIERRFRIAGGWGGQGDKRKLGDHHTPVGIYRIMKVHDNDHFHIFMLLNYPNVKDAYWGLKNRLIDRREFDSIVNAAKEGRTPPQDTPLGGSIGIHGIADQTEERVSLHEAANWTEGCIALTNEQVDELHRYVNVGTRVVINE